MVTYTPKGLNQRVAAQEAEAAHARTRLIEAVRDGSDGGAALQQGIDELEFSHTDDQRVKERITVLREKAEHQEREAVRAHDESVAAAARGDHQSATEYQEMFERGTAAAHATRDRLSRDETRLDEIRSHNRDIDDAEVRVGEKWADLRVQRRVAETELDKYEDQNGLLAQAQAKFSEADRTGDPATAQAAQALLDQADQITVDRNAIRAEVPELGEVPPTDLDEVERNFDTGPADDGPHGLGEDTGPDLVPDQTNPDLNLNFALDDDLVPDQTNPDDEPHHGLGEDTGPAGLPSGLAERIATQTAEAARTRAQLLDNEVYGRDGRAELDRQEVALDASRPDVRGLDNRWGNAKVRATAFENNATELRAEADAALARGEIDKAAELNEQADIAHAQFQHGTMEMGRIRDQMSAAAGVDSRIDAAERDLDTRRSELTSQWRDAEKELDKYEQQNALLTKAQAKFVEAGRTGDPATSAAAQALLDQADAITVNSDVIRMEVADFAGVVPTEPVHPLDPKPDLVPDQTNPDPVAPDLVLDQTNPDLVGDDVAGGVVPASPDGDRQDGPPPPGDQQPHDHVIDLGDVDDPGFLGGQATPAGGVPAPDAVTVLDEIAIEGGPTRSAAEAAAGAADSGPADVNIVPDPDASPMPDPTIESGPSVADAAAGAAASGPADVGIEPDPAASPLSDAPIDSISSGAEATAESGAEGVFVDDSPSWSDSSAFEQPAAFEEPSGYEEAVTSQEPSYEETTYDESDEDW